MSPLNNHGFNEGDFVTFHTVRGKSTGIIEYFKGGDRGTFRLAVITVNINHYKSKRYTRPLFKIKKLK